MMSNTKRLPARLLCALALALCSVAPALAQVESAPMRAGTTLPLFCVNLRVTFNLTQTDGANAPGLYRCNGSVFVPVAVPTSPGGSAGDIQTNGGSGAFGSLTPGAGVAALLGTFSSANLRAALPDESGTGAAVFAGGNIGAATATSINGSTFPATAAALSGVVHVATSGANSGTAETDLSSYTLPAGTLSADGKCLRVTLFAAFGATGNQKSVRFYFGSTSILLPNATTASGGTAYHVWTICRTGATSQVIFGRASLAGSNTGNESQNTDQFQTPAENTANAITIKVTGQSNAASNDILLKGFVVELLN